MSPERISQEPPPPTRLGDLSAMLRVLKPLHPQLVDPTAARRQMLADLCRFIGVKVGAVSAAVVRTSEPPETNGELSPRLEQTLNFLLDGKSEKQVARSLQLSPHTVHGYVKTLYRKFGVSSRAELLAKHLKR